MLYMMIQTGELRRRTPATEDGATWDTMSVDAETGHEDDVYGEASQLLAPLDKRDRDRGMGMGGRRVGAQVCACGCACARAGAMRAAVAVQQCAPSTCAPRVARVKEAWEGWASSHLPPRGGGKRCAVMVAIMLAVATVVVCVLVAAVAALYSYRGPLLLRAGGTLRPEEAVQAGMPLASVVDASRMPLDIHDHDDEHTKLWKFRRHEAAHVVPHRNLAEGCGAGIGSGRLRVRAGQFSASGAKWVPWPPVATHTHTHVHAHTVSAVPVLQGVLPMGCSDPAAAIDLDLLGFVDRAKTLMRGLRHTCVTGPHVGINATLLVLNLAASDVDVGPKHDMLFVALQPEMTLRGLTETKFREHDDACAFEGATPVRWRAPSVDLYFVSASDMKPRHLSIRGVAAASVQHCMDFFARNPCAQ